MQNITKKALVATMLISCGIAHADDTHLIVQTRTGNSQFELNTLQSISLNETGIGIKDKNGKIDAFEYENIEKFYFQMLVNMIETNPVTTFHVNIDKTGSMLNIQGVDDFSNINIYNMNGQIVKKMSQWKGNSIDISSLTPGVYIIQVNKQALKFKK
ncbi:T9SS type A sorting domain-containing protein [Prevotella sp. OH937_COT-195]|uniref:T9SS type A sorting domain-containing protein n=1 Tax=Prevotella sp. OH937_COT-195 TaxID=2491051 RepID=UPI000F645C5F|nr:T9SS type A sorting domain-containing protein [Prevotella sp. OH937_COT-195]RRC98418.1 T9SS C-terminal target domain-containing protein [Prevotella sp. OH937_COT-195]